MENKIKATPEEMAKDMVEGKEAVVLCDENGNCNGCSDCCGIITPISSEELKILNRKASKKHFMQFVKNQIEIEKKGEEGISATCLFFMNGKCSIYSLRPSICKDFHCRQDLRKQTVDPRKFKGKVHFIFEVLPKELQGPFQRVVNEANKIKQKKKCILEK